MKAHGYGSRTLSPVPEERSNEANDGKDADCHPNSNSNFGTGTKTLIASSVSCCGRGSWQRDSAHERHYAAREGGRATESWRLRRAGEVWCRRNVTWIQDTVMEVNILFGTT
jgi:hypothetical protein